MKSTNCADQDELGHVHSDERESVEQEERGRVEQEKRVCLEQEEQECASLLELSPTEEQREEQDTTINQNGN